MKKLGLVVATLAILLGLSGELFAQSSTAQINGTLADATGAVVPGADVSATNQDTGLTRETTTNASGDYTFPLLPVGPYTVEARSEGFQAARRIDIRLNVNQILRVDIDMVIGEVTETMRSQGPAPRSTPSRRPSATR